MSSGLISIGLSGLNAAQAGMTTTSENIANVNTPGYSEESTVQEAADPVFSGQGYLGQGVIVSSVTRAYNSFQQQQLTEAQASSSALTTQYGQMSQIDNMLGDPTTGLSAAINTFFTSVQGVASAPSDVSARQTMLGDAQSLSSSFNSVAQQLQQLSTATTQNLTQSVASANTLATQIASLNQQITSASTGGTGQAPNTLLDQRDALVQQINQDVGATSITQSDGSIDVFVGNGQPLVLGSVANTLTAVPTTADPQQLELALQDGAATTRLAAGQLQGGSIAGLLTFNNGALQSTINDVGQIAIGVASAMNQQNEMGQDNNGDLGGAIFTVAQPSVLGASSNTGDGAISASITDATKLTGSNYQLTYNGSQYTLTRLSDHATTSFTSMPQTVDGVTIAITQPLAAGDSFSIAPTAAGASGISVSMVDPNKIAAASPVLASFGENNLGDLAQSTLAVTSGLPLPSTLQDSVDVSFQVSGGNTTYSAVDNTTGQTLASGATYSAGTPITLNGWSLTLSGSPANGDTVSVGANTDGTSDNTNALALADLQTAPRVNSTSFSGAYQQIVGQVGATTDALQATSTAQASILTNAQTALSSTSGVNLDDEAANLLKYQQAYQASSQAIATANSMFTSIIDLFSSIS